MTILKIIPDFENKTAECVGYPSAGEHVDVRIVGAANLLPSPTLRFRVKFGHVTLALFPRLDVNEVWETEGSDLKCHLNLNTVQARSVCRTGNTVCHAILDQLGDDEHTVEPTLFFDDLFDVTPWCRESGADEPYDLDRYPNQIADLNQRVNEIGGKIAEAKNAAEEAAGSARAAYESAQSAVEAAQSANARANAAESAARGASADALRARNDADAAVEAISRTPRIDETTHRWMVWDAEHGEFVDTGVSAIGPQGEKGDDGITPHIGSNGHWFVGTTDTGISAQGPKGDKGEKGEPGESAILDDTVTQSSANGVKSSGIWSWVKSLLPSWLTPSREEPPTQESVANKADKATGLTGATKCKLTYNAQGIVTAGADLAASDLPTHTHTKSQITDFPTTMTPTAHASTHATGGSDAITPASIGALPSRSPYDTNAQVAWDGANLYFVLPHIIFDGVSSIYASNATILGRYLLTPEGPVASIAPEYDATSEYEVGQFVYHDGSIYRCTTAIPVSGETWNPAHWSAAQKVDDFFKESNTLLGATIEAKVNSMFDNGDTTSYPRTTEG